MNKIIQEDMESVLKSLGEKVKRLENKNILITGASGMLASYLVHFLIFANKFILDKPANLYLVIRNKEHIFGKQKNVHIIPIDISKEIPNVPSPDYIIHAASKAAPKIYTKNKIDTLNTNILGLYNLLHLRTKRLKSFLYFSSSEVYGQVMSQEAINEEYVGRVDNLNERSCYVEGKRAGETICKNYFWEQDLPVKIARIFHTFGPGINLNDGRLFSDFIKNGLNREDIQIYGDTELKRPLLYIKDATIMFLLLLLSNKNGEVYNVANDLNNVSVLKFANIVCEEFNIHYKRKLAVDIYKDKRKKYYRNTVKEYKPDINKFRNDFNYKPNTTVRDAVSRTVSYYLNK